MKLVLFSFLLNFLFVHNTGIESLVVQHEGRVKPLDTLARESLRSVYGKETFKDRSATDVILSWFLVSDFWEKEDFIFIESAEVKKSLELDQTKKRFSPETLRTNKNFALQIIELQSLRQRKETLGKYFKKLEKLETKLLIYESVKSGWLLKVQPSKQDSAWLSLFELSGKAEQGFKQVIGNYVSLITSKQRQKFKGFDLFKRKEELKKSISQFEQIVFGEERNKEIKIQVEILYNKWKPFRLAWILYFIFLFAVSLNAISGYKIKSTFFTILPFLGFLLHTLGIVARSYIMSRPPVSNMFETVIWVPWIALISSVFFNSKSKLSKAFIAGVIICFFSLFLTDLVPQILDGRLRPLEAVLRSNFWLSTHVLIITASYSFFFLAFALGDIALFSYIFKKGLVPIRTYAQPIYRLLQWGVILLTAGTLLGAVWADYSWGRFWGWDPKESWALISLLAYLAVLHGRLIGLIKDFELIISAILMFFLIVMAWYGVNFILGKGLHSYGFGTGGSGYVGGFFLIHIILSGVGLFLSKRKLRQLK